MAFHPKFKENGEFFVYYTTKDDAAHVGRLAVQGPKADHNAADPGERRRDPSRSRSRIWNHNGGTIAFGPDGYLYIGLGDGGAANDPYGNGQNLEHAARQDPADRRRSSRTRARPTPFPRTTRSSARSGAAPEIWAYGIRNVWRIAFDRKTGDLWAADVGQDIWEEINIVKAGGNYGWNLREGMHRFRPKARARKREFIEPIWEYHHDVGKSITGGHVYRGKHVPELAGHVPLRRLRHRPHLGPEVRRGREEGHRQPPDRRQHRCR